MTTDEITLTVTCPLSYKFFFNFCHVTEPHVDIDIDTANYKVFENRKYESDIRLDNETGFKKCKRTVKY